MSQPAQPKLAVVVLGFVNDERGVLSSVAMERCEQALREYARHPGARIIPTGGWGAHFNTTGRSHGYYLTGYFKEKGVPEADLLEVAESANTVEDARLCLPVARKHGLTKLIVVTSDFHLARARFLFELMFEEMALEFSGSTTVLPEEELEKRKAHEEKALKWLRESPPKA